MLMGRGNKDAIPRDQIVGLRKLPPHRWPFSDRYELQLESGDSLSCSRCRLRRLLDVREHPVQYQSIIQAADHAFTRGDRSLILWPTGHRRPDRSEPKHDTVWRRGAWLESEGFRVKATGQSGMDYVDAAGPLHVDSEMLGNMNLVVYTYSIPPDRPFILENIARAWLWAGFDVRVDRTTNY